MFAKTASVTAHEREAAPSPPSRSRSFVAHRALPVEPIEVFPPASTAKEGAEIYGIMAWPMTVALTEDERKKFDDIGLDDINAMTDVNQLNKLAKYMECVFPTRPSGSPRGIAPDDHRSPIWMDARQPPFVDATRNTRASPFSRAERHSETRRAVTRREGTHATETETETDWTD